MFDFLSLSITISALFVGLVFILVPWYYNRQFYCDYYNLIKSYALSYWKIAVCLIGSGAAIDWSPCATLSPKNEDSEVEEFKIEDCGVLTSSMTKIGSDQEASVKVTCTGERSIDGLNERSFDSPSLREGLLPPHDKGLRAEELLPPHDKGLRAEELMQDNELRRGDSTEWDSDSSFQLVSRPKDFELRAAATTGPDTAPFVPSSSDKRAGEQILDSRNKTGVESEMNEIPAKGNSTDSKFVDGELKDDLESEVKLLEKKRCKIRERAILQARKCIVEEHTDDRIDRKDSQSDAEWKDEDEDEDDSNEDIEKAEEFKLKGNQFFKSDDLDEALMSYSKALSFCSSKPSSSKLIAVLLCNRAACHIARNKFETAILDCTDAIELDSSYAKAYLRRFRAYQALEKWHDALADINKALEIDEKLKSKYTEEQQRIQLKSQEAFDKEKLEMMEKLKSFGNWALGKVGLSLENFKVEQNDTGAYNISFQQNTQ